MLIRFLLLLLLAAAAAPAGAATLEAQTVEKLQQIRAIRPGQGDQADDAYNKQLDAAWRSSMPTSNSAADLAQTAEAESKGTSPITWFAWTSVGTCTKAICRTGDAGPGGLFHLDPRASIVDWNRKEFLS